MRGLKSINHLLKLVSLLLVLTAAFAIENQTTNQTRPSQVDHQNSPQRQFIQNNSNVKQDESKNISLRDALSIGIDLAKGNEKAQESIAQVVDLISNLELQISLDKSVDAINYSIKQKKIEPQLNEEQITESLESGIEDHSFQEVEYEFAISSTQNDLIEEFNVLESREEYIIYSGGEDSTISSLETSENHLFDGDIGEIEITNVECEPSSSHNANIPSQPKFITDGQSCQIARTCNYISHSLYGRKCLCRYILFCG